ncbi:centrosomal protein of 112 kDa-like [Poeciliopsis prolifica]|uniref:centrosomal protein of 112 kDa-like n=1 Tax=Poeciliopsis prolifica TaxID=188132 RepID=UPI002413A42E|nr:centrosomal protein of 112 kDa-like [Poeciliopsis prolifica]
MSQEPRCYNRMTRPAVRRENHRTSQRRGPPVHPYVLHMEIQRLHCILEKERSQRFQDSKKLSLLKAKLEETNIQLKRQKALKEMFINRDKETQKKLERVEQFSDPGVLNAAVLAAQVHNTVKHKNKKMLQKDFEELKVALLLSQEALSSQIQAEKDKNKVLQEELDKVQTSYKELCSMYEADEAETQTVCEEQELLGNLGTERDKMFQKVSEEIAFLQNSFQEELEQIKLSYRELDCRHDEDVSGLTQKVETQEVRFENDVNLGKAIENLTAEKEGLVPKMSKEITPSEKREKEMLNELDQVKVLYQKLKTKYETDVAELQQQAETYCQKIKLNKVANLKRAKEDKKLIDELRAELDNRAQEVARLENVRKQNLSELDRVKVSHQEKTTTYEKVVSELKTQVETYRDAVDRERKANLERAEKYLQQINTLKAEKEHLCEEMSIEVQNLQQKFNMIAEHFKYHMGQCETNLSALQKTTAANSLGEERPLGEIKEVSPKLTN